MAVPGEGPVAGQLSGTLRVADPSHEDPETSRRELVILTRNNGVRCLYISAQEGHLDVVKELLDSGGRQLVMLTLDNGTSCLYMSALEGHLEVVKALLEVGGRELLMLTKDNRANCLSIARRANQGQVWRDGVAECRLFFARDLDPQAIVCMYVAESSATSHTSPPKTFTAHSKARRSALFVRRLARALCGEKC